MPIDTTGLQMPDSPETTASGQIVLRPLERGFGHTLGNTMRRILLSSLRGAAVWAFRVDGVVHEHQTIPGVVEDVHQIIRNLKALVLRLDEGVEEATLELRVSRTGSVTARDIRSAAGVEIVNPEHHILELREDRDFRMELFVDKGRGFVLAEQHPFPRGAPADLIRIDAIYNPVRRANFVVEETRVGQRTDFDRLVLQVETNGAVDVTSAVQYAAQLAIEHLSFLAGVSDGALAASGNGGDGHRAAGAASMGLLEQEINEVQDLSIRTRNSLLKANIRTVGDLVGRTEDQMLQIENFGPKSLQEINDYLSGRGLRLGLRAEGDGGSAGGDGGLGDTNDSSGLPGGD